MELKPLSDKAKNFVHGRYRHYKGGEYQTYFIARNSETLEELVVYQDVNDSQKVWCRPLEMFLGSVKIDEKITPRFTKTD